MRILIVGLLGAILGVISIAARSQELPGFRVVYTSNAPNQSIKKCRKKNDRWTSCEVFTLDGTAMLTRITALEQQATELKAELQRQEKLRVDMAKELEEVKRKKPN
jgi:hypothetical protein